MAEWPCCHDPLRFSPASLRFVPPPPFQFNFPPKFGEATHPTLCIFTYLSSLRMAFTYLGMPCLGLPCFALACRCFGKPCLDMPRHRLAMRFALPCCALALACLGLDMPCLGLALALPHSRHFEKVRLLEAWHGVSLACVGMKCLGIAPFKAFRETEPIGSLACLGLDMRWHVVPWPWHALGLACLGLDMPCLALPWPWHCPIQGISRK